MPSNTIYHLLANAVLATHIAIVLFVVLGLLLIVIGNWRGWRWVNHWWFRIAHLAAIVVVVAEAWLDITCPLTTLEMWLRAKSGSTIYSGGFIEHWMQQLLYYNAPPWVFIAAYSAFGLLVLATWFYFPPQRKRNSK